MALGLNIGGGDAGEIIPIIKYDARAGRIQRVDREDGMSSNTDITNGFKAVFDLENIEVGYIMFAAGSAPDFQMVPLNSPLPARPSDQHKQGVRLLVKLSPSQGGDVRELASTANAFLGALNSLHDAYLKEAPANQGKLPVVCLEGVTAVTTGGKQKSTNYVPTFSIVSWVPRPADLNGGKSQPAPANVKASPPSTGSTKVSAPVADDDDFG